MGRLSARWRRFWGIRPGELRRPVRIIGRGRVMGEPQTGPHGRGWQLRHGRFRRRPEAGSSEPLSTPASVADLLTGPARQIEFPVSIVADEEISDRLRAHALEMVDRLARLAPRPVIHARVTLRERADPALERPAIAKAALDVSGRQVRAHVAAGQMTEAIDLLEGRLRRNLEDLEELDRTLRRETGVPEPGEWRHGSLPTARPEHYPRPIEERELVRRKTFALSEMSPEEAALEMQALDYDFHLFTNADTGEENVVYRRPDGTAALAQITPAAERGALPLAVDPAPAPVLLVEDAIERLNLSGERFVFFVDAQTRSGNVLYLRYDGHYGLIAPAETESPRHSV